MEIPGATVKAMAEKMSANNPAGTDALGAPKATGKKEKISGFDAEELLTVATDKFIKRFIIVEKLANDEKIDIKTAGIEKLNLLWDIAKQEKE